MCHPNPTPRQRLSSTMRSSERHPSVTQAACLADSAASPSATGATSLSLSVRPPMSIRPVHIWWFGVVLFTPSLIAWLWTSGRFVYGGTFRWQMDWIGITRVYLPVCAAFLGLVIPLTALRFFQSASLRRTMLLFVTYVVSFVLWGVTDIQHQNWQARGMLDKQYWHAYYTWYFLPYRWIE